MTMFCTFSDRYVTYGMHVYLSSNASSFAAAKVSCSNRMVRTIGPLQVQMKTDMARQLLKIVEELTTVRYTSFIAVCSPQKRLVTLTSYFATLLKFSTPPSEVPYSSRNF